MPGRIAVGLLATLVLVSGCAQRRFVFVEQDQSPAQLAKDQAECTAEAKENTGSSEAVKRGFGTTLGAPMAGALVGAGLGGAWRPLGTRKPLSTTPFSDASQARVRDRASARLAPGTRPGIIRPA